MDYHDEYLVELNSSGRPRVTILTRDQKIEDVRYEAGHLSFVQHTTFRVAYSLQLEPDGKSLLGTATTPETTVDIKWEKIQ